MRDRNKGKDVPQEKENAEIQKVLQKIPVSELMNTLVEKMQHSPEEEAREVVQTAIFGQSFSGPIPHPEVLAGYAAAGSDIADRIVKMAESEQRHRQELEEKSVEASIKTEKRGQNYALFVSLSIIVGALYLIGSGKEVYGVILAGGTLIGLASVFITGKKKDK